MAFKKRGHVCSDKAMLIFFHHVTWPCLPRNGIKTIDTAGTTKSWVKLVQCPVHISVWQKPGSPSHGGFSDFRGFTQEPGHLAHWFTQKKWWFYWWVTDSIGSPNQIFPKQIRAMTGWNTSGLRNGHVLSSARWRCSQQNHGISRGITQSTWEFWWDEKWWSWT